MYSPRWTSSILAEWQYHLRRSNPLKPEGWVSRYRKALEDAFPHGLIEDFSVTQPEWLSDVHDAHVHSAAVSAAVDYLVTDDRGWETAPLAELTYEVHTSDTFLSLCLDSQPQVLGQFIAEQLARAWKSRSGDAVDIVGPLKRAGAVQFAQRVQKLCGEAWVQEKFEQLIMVD